jgi:hypothetical protein
MGRALDRVQLPAALRRDGQVLDVVYLLPGQRL